MDNISYLIMINNQQQRSVFFELFTATINDFCGTVHYNTVHYNNAITCTGEGNYFSVILTLKQIDIVSGDAVAGEKKKKEMVKCCLYSIVVLLWGGELIPAFICQEAEGFLVGLPVHLRTGPQRILYEKAVKNKKSFLPAI